MRLQLDAFNLFNVKANQIEYYYESRLANEPVRRRDLRPPHPSGRAAGGAPDAGRPALAPDRCARPVDPPGGRRLQLTSAVVNCNKRQPKRATPLRRSRVLPDTRSTRRGARGHVAVRSTSFARRAAAAALLWLAACGCRSRRWPPTARSQVDDTDVDPVGALQGRFLGVSSHRTATASAWCRRAACSTSGGRSTSPSASSARARTATGARRRSVKFRTLIVEGGVGKWSLLFSTGATYDFTTGDVSTVLVNIPATFQALENLKLNLNAGWLYDRPNEVHWATWGASFDWSVNDRLTLIGEVFGQLGHEIEDSPHLNRSAGAVRVPLQAERERRFRRDLRPQHHRRECPLDHARPQRTLQCVRRARRGIATDPEAADPQIECT